MQQLNINIFNVIIAVGIIHGLIFGLILLIHHRLKSRTNTYLALTVFSLALSNFQYWLKDVGLYPNAEYLPFLPFEFLMLPFFYCFVKSYLNKRIMQREIGILFFFFPLFIIYQYVVTERYFSISQIEYINLVIEYISIAYSILLIIIVFRRIIKYEMEANTSHTLKIATSWLKHLLIIGLLLCVIWALSFNLMDVIFPEGYYRFYPLWIGISILIYWIGYSSIFQKDIFRDRQSIRNINHNQNVKKKTDSNGSKFKVIESIIVEDKLFLNSAFSLSTLSKNMQLSEGYVSQLFKKHGNQSFNEYINTLRVNEAKRMLADTAYNDYTIIAIGLESGFNSKSSFYSVFKKHTHKTPNQYKKEVQNF